MSRRCRMPGAGMSDQRLGAIVEQHDGTYIPMMAGDSIEV